jgi:hypothetical protein
MRPPEAIRTKETVPSGDLLWEDAITSHPRNDTLQVQIIVNVKERAINYDSIYRAQSTRIATVPAAGKAAHIARKSKAPPVEEPIVRALKPAKAAGSVQKTRSSLGKPDRYSPPQDQDLSGKIIISAGLVLILIGVILQLFLKKGLALAVCGIAVVLIGLIFL